MLTKSNQVDQNYVIAEICSATRRLANKSAFDMLNVSFVLSLTGKGYKENKRLQEQAIWMIVCSYDRHLVLPEADFDS